MLKKGQLTIFIIIGLVVLMVVGITLFVVFRASESAEGELPRLRTAGAAEVSEMVEGCLGFVGAEAVYLAGAGGGYLNPAGDDFYGEVGDRAPAHYVLDSDFVPYLVDGKIRSFRPLADVSASIERYIAVELGNCLNFTSFEQQGFNVLRPDVAWREIGFDFSKARVDYSAEQVRIEAVPRAEDVVVRANYPLKLERSNQVIEVSQFTVIVPLRLSLVYDIALELAKDVSAVQEYKLAQGCAKFSQPDGAVNIYSKTAPYVLQYGIQIVDSKPLESGSLPLRFKFAMKNLKFSGECIA